MNKSLYFILIAITLFLNSCTDSSCGETACFTPAEPFTFALLDNTNNENLFTSNTFNSEDLKIIDTETLSEIDFQFISDDNLNLISLNSIGWSTEKKLINFK